MHTVGLMDIIGSICFSLPNTCTGTALLGLGAGNTKMKPPPLKQLITVGRHDTYSGEDMDTRGCDRGTCQRLCCFVVLILVVVFWFLPLERGG